MIIIFGTRHYGVVDRHAGEYALTRVFHLYYLPVIPLGSMWVTAEHDGQLSGHRIRPHLRSMAAAFIRPWGILLGVLGVLGAFGTYQTSGASAGLAVLIASLVALGLAVLSLIGGDVRAPGVLRERELARAAFGTCCDPKYLPRRAVDNLLGWAEDEWARTSSGRSPGDVARFGPSSPDEGLRAWALLRLRARTAPRSRRAALEADATRIASAIHEAPTMGSPYRNAGLEQVTT